MVDELVLEKLFVYGSFCEGFVHHQKLQNSVVSSEKASILGTTYITRVGYPVVCEGGEDSIPGELLELYVSSPLREWMNRFFEAEGTSDKPGKFIRKFTQVSCASGKTEMAQAYFLNPLQLNKTLKRAVSLNWVEEMRVNPPLPQQLTLEQRSYLTRLSRVSGREIIPIDLKLYRELINLEMIVDKGRRLALSKLGHEVVRFLE